jgi:hypothetical protein
LRRAARHGCVQDAIVRGRPCCRQPNSAAWAADLRAGCHWPRQPLFSSAYHGCAGCGICVQAAIVRRSPCFCPPGLRDSARAPAPPRAPKGPRPSGPNAQRLTGAVYLGCCWGTSPALPERRPSGRTEMPLGEQKVFFQLWQG